MHPKGIVCGCGLDLCGSVQGLVMGSFERGNEVFGSITGEEFLDKLCHFEILKNSARWN
jgi:hypothetical protein